MAIDLDKECDRLMKLLDVGLDQLKAGDDTAALLCLKEALESAQRLPKKSDDKK
jgi:hypothetical protein